MTSQETSRQSRLVTSAPVSLWRMGRPDSPPFVAPQGQSCASSRVSSITPSTLCWAWSTTPMSGGSHAAASLYLISGYLSQSRPCFGVAICNIFNSTDFFFSSDWSSTCFCLSTYLVRVDFFPPPFCLLSVSTKPPPQTYRLYVSTVYFMSSVCFPRLVSTGSSFCFTKMGTWATKPKWSLRDSTVRELACTRHAVRTDQMPWA